MYLLLLGLVLLGLWWGGVAPVAQWPWWGVAIPFALTAIWWLVADATGLTRRSAMRREEKRKEDRREKHLAAMGLEGFDRKSSGKIGRRSAGQGHSRQDSPTQNGELTRQDVKN